MAPRLKFYRVGVLPELRIVSVYDVTIEAYSLPDLDFPKIKNASFVAPESERLSCACAVSFPYSPAPTH